MRDESCQDCNVPLMKNKLGEMYCVNCHKFYMVRGDLLYMIRQGASQKPPSTGTYVPPPATSAPAPTATPPPASVPAVSVPVVSTPAGPPPETSLPKSTPSRPSSVNYTQKKIQLLETVIIPGLEARIAELCGQPHPGPYESVDRVDVYLKSLRGMYEELSKYMSECKDLKQEYE